MLTSFLINHMSVARVEPMFTDQVIDIAVDPSKSHTGIVIATADDSRKVAIECLAGGSNVDVFEACAEIHIFMNTLLKGSTIRLAGVEDPITKDSYRVKDKNGKTVRINPGMETHENRLKLSAVFTTFMNVLRLNANHEIIRVNNNEWKASVLPAEFRTRDVGKGSNIWLPQVEPGFAGYDDNVTDAGCILLYLRKEYKAEKIVCKKQITGVELSLYKHDFVITDNCMSEYPRFVYNSMLKFEENLAYVSNRVKGGLGIIEIPVSEIPVSVIYTERFRPKKVDSDVFAVLIGGVS